MRAHLQRDLITLKKMLLQIGSLVEEATEKALRALFERRVDLAHEVQVGDLRIDELEVNFEEECLKVLALHQPVAGDLRHVVAFLKVNNDLERVGDLAQNLAERAEFLSARPVLEIPIQIQRLGDRVRRMLHECLNAVVNADTTVARQVLDDDEIVDREHEAFYRFVQENIQADPHLAEEWLQVLSVSRYLERIADQATNIAEDVVFMAEGAVIRHGFDPEG